MVTAGLAVIDLFEEHWGYGYITELIEHPLGGVRLVEITHTSVVSPYNKVATPEILTADCCEYCLSRSGVPGVGHEPAQ